MLQGPPTDAFENLHISWRAQHELERNRLFVVIHLNAAHPRKLQDSCLIEIDSDACRPVRESRDKMKIARMHKQGHPVALRFTPLQLSRHLHQLPVVAQRSYLETVKLSPDALLTVLNDILDFSKIEGGHLSLDPVPCVLSEVVVGAVKSLAVRAAEKGLELNCEFDEDAPESLVVDEVRLRQILINLVGNAVKFTERGEILVRVSVLSMNVQPAQLQLSIIDTGIGIAQSKLNSIFSPFTQADTSTARKYGGTGLELAISTRRASLMGGRLWAESEPGLGSRFHFTGTFKLRDCAGTSLACLSRPLEGVRVLLVDDLATTRGILESILSRWGLLCTAVSSQVEALDALNKAEQYSDRFELMIVSCQISAGDGLELVQQVRTGVVRNQPAVVMVGTSLHHRCATRSQDLRIAAWLIKPLGNLELRDAILRALSRTEPAARRTPVVAAPELRRRPLNILLAEDNRVNQVVASHLLEREGHRVTIADNGNEVLAIHANHSSRFDLILMDVQMPDRDGFETTAEIRRREAEAGEHIPIFALTAHAMKGDRERCLAAGMDGYIAKPIQVSELQSVLNSLFAIRTDSSAYR